MSEEKKPKTLSRAETWKRITHLSLGAPFDSAKHRLLNECIQLQRTEQKAEDERSDKHTSAVALKELAHEQGELRKDFANLGNDVCQTVEKHCGIHIPPKPKDVDDDSGRTLYKSVKTIKAKRGVRRKDLETLLEKSPWRFRGYSAREIYKDVDGLNRFYHKMGMRITRHPDEN